MLYPSWVTLPSTSSLWRDVKGGATITAIGFYGRTFAPEHERHIDPPHAPVRMHLKAVMSLPPRLGG